MFFHPDNVSAGMNCVATGEKETTVYVQTEVGGMRKEEQAKEQAGTGMPRANIGNNAMTRVSSGRRKRTFKRWVQ